MPPESLEIRSKATLAAREADGGRWLTLLVTVRNPRDRAVRAKSPIDPRPIPGSFGYDMRGPAGGVSGGLLATDSATLLFQPFETKGWLFEFRVGSELGHFRFAPGAYLVRGEYARRFSPYDTVVVRP